MVSVNLLAIILAAVLTFSITETKQLDSYVNCGGAGRIENITVVPCDSEPCELVKESKVNIHFVGSFSRDSNSVRLKPSATLDKLNITLPGVDLELCGKHIKCPIKANELQDASIEVPIMKIYPSKKIEVAFLVFCEDELQFCIRTDVIIKDK